MKNIALMQNWGKAQIFVPMLSLFLVLFSGCTEHLVDTEDLDNPDNPVVPDKPGNPTKPSETDYSLTAENHPRLVMRNADFEDLKAKLAAGTNPKLNKMHELVIKSCENAMQSGTPISASEFNSSRISLCAYAYRITGDKKYLRYAEDDLKTIASNTDWGVSRSYLETSAVCMGVAIGYDWLYDDLAPSTRTAVENAILNFAFKPIIDKTWVWDFYQSRNNWNQVCCGGTVCAALAIYERDPVTAQRIIDNAIDAVPKAMAEIYSPDGNGVEGPDYWTFGSDYESMMLLSMETALGTDYGISNVPGFDKTGQYKLYTSGMNFFTFHYADCSKWIEGSFTGWYLAHRFKDPSILYYHLYLLDMSNDKSDYFTFAIDGFFTPMIMALAKDINFDNVSAPTKKLWSGNGITPVVMVHSDWTWSASDKFLGIKGGKANSSHAHMDAGSFVYDANNVRWSKDFLIQTYASLEGQVNAMGGDFWDYSQNSWRWKAFRWNCHSHSTITINDADHLVDGAATIKKTFENSTEVGATLDMTAVVADQAASAYRTLKIVNDRDLVVIDEIKALGTKSATVQWRMATETVPTMESSRIVLTSGSKKMYLKANAGSLKVTYRQWSVKGNYDFDESNEGSYIVGFEATIPAGKSATLTTTLSPQE